MSYTRGAFAKGRNKSKHVKVAIYARYSTDDSTDKQRDARLELLVRPEGGGVPQGYHPLSRLRFHINLIDTTHFSFRQKNPRTRRGGCIK